MKPPELHQGSQSSGRTKLHNVRFYNSPPRPIQVLAYNKLSQKLALSRDDGSIEIWDMQYAPNLEKTIPQPHGNSVEDLLWVDDRLFSAGLTGEVVEWNLQKLLPLRKQYVTGNAIWCLAMNNLGSELAIGTEEGYINIFDIADGKMQYKHLFDKQEGRVLCCKFDKSGEHLVTGSMGAIRIWHVASGHAVNKMTMARALKNVEVIVWSLQVLNDFTIISGDSRGFITIWDGHTAAEVESHHVLKADVLTVAVNEEENLLMCSGIEPVTRIYAKTVIKKEEISYNRWVKFLQRSVHDHDVKSLVCAGDRIISGGMDGYLGISSMLKAKSDVTTYGSFLQNPCAAVATGKNMLLLRYRDYLEIWRLGTTSGKPAYVNEVEDEAAGTTAVSRKWLALTTGPQKLVELRNPRPDPIVCATISPNGQWICYSTMRELRLFRFRPADGNISPSQVQRITDLPEQFGSASHLYFPSDSRRLFIVKTLTRQIAIFSMPSNNSSDVDFVEFVDTAKHIKDTISIFTVSLCGTYMAAAGTDRSIAVWSMHKGKHFKHQLNLPRYTAATSAIALHPQQTRLVAAFTDGKIFEYDFEEMCFTCSERAYFVDSAEKHPVINIVLDARSPNVFIMQSHASLYSLKKCSAIADGDRLQNDKAVKKAKRSIQDVKVQSLKLCMHKSFEHLLYLAWAGLDDLIAVGVNRISIIVQLPDAFQAQKFGTM